MASDNFLSTKSDPSRRAQNPLYRCLTDAASQRTQYLIAYQAVTLLPFDDSGVPNEPYPGTIAIYLAEGADAQQNIEVHSQDIYIYFGSRFSFPGKTLSLIASRIFGVPVDKNPLAREIIFDCSGVPGATNNDIIKDDPGGNGEDCAITYHSVEKIVHQSPPRGPRWFEQTGGGNWTIEGTQTSGYPGGQGGNGNDGKDGGSIRIVGQLICSGKAKGYLKLDIRGGQPSEGQHGGTGGQAGTLTYLNIDDYNKDREAANKQGAWKPHIDNQPVFGYLPPERPPHQGAGGHGGDAGNFGAPGTVYMQYANIDSDQDFPLFWDPRFEDRSVKGGSGGTGDPLGADGSRALEPVMFTQITPTDRGVLLDPIHLMMVIQRLTFEYTMLFSSRRYLPSGTITTQEEAFGTSLTWVADALAICQVSLKKDGDKVNKTRKALVSQASLAYKELQKRLVSVTDNYGNPFNYIPDASIAIAYITDELNALAATEKRLKDMSTKLEEQEGNRATLRSTFADVGQQVESLQQTIYDLIGTNSSTGTLAQQLAKVQELQTNLGSCQTVLETHLKDVWNESKNTFSPHCTGWQGVFGALSSVMMFAQPEIGSLYVVGSAISVATSVGEVDSGTTDSGIKNEFIADSIHAVAQSIDGPVMQQKIETLSQESALLKQQDPNFLALIAADREKFLALCDKYIEVNKLKAVKDVKADFGVFLKTAQDRNQAILDYNRLVMKYYKARLEYTIASKNQVLLQSSNAELTNDDADLLYIYYSRAVNRQTSHAMETLYNGMLAYNCASLKRSGTFEAMAGLGSFDKINQDVMSTALCGSPNGQLGLSQELSKFIATLGDSKTYTDVAFSIKHTTDKRSLRLFQDTKEMKIVPTFKTKTEYGFNDTWYDIRLCDLQIFLIGARGIDAKDPKLENKSIKVDIDFGNVFEVWDYQGTSRDGPQEWIPHYFEMPRKPTTFSYTYDRRGNKDLKDYTRTQTRDTYMASFKFCPHPGDPAVEYSYPLTSPFMDYHITVGSLVDLSDLTEVRVVMEVRARTAYTPFVWPKAPASPDVLGTEALESSSPVVESQNETLREKNVAKHQHVLNSTLSVAATPSLMNAGDDLPALLTMNAPSHVNDHNHNHRHHHHHHPHLRAHVDAETDKQPHIELFYVGTSLRTFLIHLKSPTTSGTSLRNDGGTLGRALEPSPRGFSTRKRIELPIRQFQEIWKPFGATSDKQALAWATSKDIQLGTDVQTQAFMKLHAMLDRLEASGESRAGMYFGGNDWDQFGHVAAGGGVVAIDDNHAKRLVDEGEGVYAFFDAFPNDNVIFFDQNHSAQINALPNGRETRKYIKTNFATIKADEKKMKAAKQNPEGNLVMLASGAIIGLKSVKTRRVGTLDIISAEAVTTGIHFVDGMAGWMGARDSTRPGLFTQFNMHLGQHPLRAVDAGNSMALNRLLWTIRNSLPYALEAKDLDTHIQQVVQAKDLLLSTERQLWNSVDAATILMAEVRAWQKPNVVYEFQPREIRGPAVDLSYKTLSDISLPFAKSKEPALIVDDGQFRALDLMTMQNSSTAGTGRANPITTDQQDAVASVIEDVTRFEKSSKDVDDLRDKVLDIVDRYAAREIADAGGVPLSTSAIHSSLKNSTGFNEDVRNTVKASLADPATVAVLEDKIARLPSFKHTGVSDSDITAIVQDTTELHTIWNMTQPEALVDVWTKSKLDTILVTNQQTNPVDLGAAINTATATYQSLETSITTVRKQIATLNETDPQIVAETKKLLDLEEAKEKSEAEKRDAEELKDLEEHSNEREQERSNEEKKERDHLFEKPVPAHDGGREGGGGRGGGGGGGHHMRMLVRNRPWKQMQ
ncbi:hypothetical protein IMSHALPRED_006171 [Imshaugia aleurites]|uniref:Uncharacterized protein n=1 Tax=Imshaugia aleurites TaxID=172621 RepID=A0A8H3IR67_9LECA|nr:hypothetical protein IMSHALPRED_006171 [Imshaugia aleurites]